MSNVENEFYAILLVLACLLPLLLLLKSFVALYNDFSFVAP